MVKFSKYIFGMLLATIGIMAVLDYSYTKVMSESRPRTKFQYLRSLKNTKFDYIFLGSSRVENAINPSIIKKITNKDALNMGFQASEMSDIYTILKLMQKYNIQSKKVLIEIDFNYNRDGASNIMQYQLMPFLKENEVTEEYSRQNLSDDQALYYFPFYRYCQNDVKIGFRETTLNIAGKKTTVAAQKGYAELHQQHTVHYKNSLPDTIARSNKTFDKIKKFCKAHRIDVIFYCSPFCGHSKNLDYISKLKKQIPELKDYSNAVKHSDQFKDCFHLNGKGATEFTSILAKDILSD